IWIQQRSSGIVHHYQDGVDLEQMTEYKGRTELLRKGLSDGNLDLHITAVSSSDRGSYICIVQDDDGYSEALGMPPLCVTAPWLLPLWAL
uniref:Ig-like domain-containing protein n=1 Tax=Gallus gallus TaxID=9031 RepID=A0A8V0XDM4_CHICK